MPVSSRIDKEHTHENIVNMVKLPLHAHGFIYINNFCFAIEWNYFFFREAGFKSVHLFFLSSSQLHYGVRFSSIYFSFTFSRKSLSTEFFLIFQLNVDSYYNISGFKNLDFSVGNSFSFRQNWKSNLNWAWQITDRIFWPSVSLICHLNMKSYLIVFYKTISQ